MSRDRKKMAAVLLLVVMGYVTLLGGCGNASVATVPTLLEPSSANAAYRKVELGSIEDVKVLYGTVVPMTYSCFFDIGAEVERIVVEVGDYVEEGEIVAYADTEALRKSVESLKLQKENQQINFELGLQISQLEIVRMSQAGQRETENAAEGDESSQNPETESGSVSGGDMDGMSASVSSGDAAEDTEAGEAAEQAAKEMGIRVAAALENLNYEGMLHEYRMENLQKEIDRQQALLEVGVLRAPHSGVVTYTKDLSETVDALAYENIVMISNGEETCLELKNRTIKQYAYKDYDIKYLYHAGRRMAVEEIPYSVEAQVLAKAGGMYPKVRLCCPDAEALVVGHTYPIYFSEKESEELPIIGQDSLYGEQGAYFVYVKAEDGNRKKRVVTVGASDDHYVQVLSGLAVGEEVYYESDTRIPASYTEYRAERSSYCVENYSKSYEMADNHVEWYCAKQGGRIKELAVRKGKEVEKGDLLYVIQTDAGRAALASAENDINRENTTFEETMKEIDKSLERAFTENEQKIGKLRKELATVNHVYQLRQLEEAYEKIARNNNGEGEIRVYANQSGIVRMLYVEEGDIIGADSRMFVIASKDEKRVLVEMEEMKEIRNYPENIADFDEEITITIGDNVYRGKCVGMTAHKDVNLGDYYVAERDGDTAITYYISYGGNNPGFYVEMEDESFYDNRGSGMVSFSFVEMEEVVVIPTALVQSETNAKNPQKTDCFVWRVEGEELVKQYVLTSDEYTDINSTVILWGIEAGDVLAKER